MSDIPFTFVAVSLGLSLVAQESWRESCNNLRKQRTENWMKQPERTGDSAVPGDGRRLGPIGVGRAWLSLIDRCLSLIDRYIYISVPDRYIDVCP